MFLFCQPFRIKKDGFLRAPSFDHHVLASVVPDTLQNATNRRCQESGLPPSSPAFFKDVAKLRAIVWAIPDIFNLLPFAERLNLNGMQGKIKHRVSRERCTRNCKVPWFTDLPFFYLT
jgi:hypothetical protein